MMVGMLPVVDTAPAMASVGPALADAHVVPQHAVLSAFDGLLNKDITLAEDDAQASADTVAQLDAWVALTLAQALESDLPAGLMPALQDGATAAPWLMQALDGREAHAEAAEDAATPMGRSALIGQAQMPSQPQGLQQGMPQAMQAGAPVGMPTVQSAEVREAAGELPAPDAERLFKNIAPAASQRDGLTAAVTQAAVQPALSTRIAGEATLPVMTLDGLTRHGLAATDLSAAQNAPASRGAASTESQQKLIDALGERLSVQTVQGMRHAVIRLDPHLNGSVRIELRQEANGITVHLSATNADVVRQLQAIGESLRQDLGARHGGDVTVQVSASRHGQPDADSSSGRERHAPDDAEQGPGRALSAAGGDGAFEFGSRDAARPQEETV